VNDVIDGEGADKAGIEENDIITELDGRTIESWEDLTSALDYYKAGETVKVKVATRDSGYKTKTVKVTLGKQPEETNNNQNNNYNNNSGYGNSDDAEDFFSFPW
jgi:serine protease Do